MSSSLARGGRARLALASLAFTLASAGSAAAQLGPADLRWSGMMFDAFTSDGIQAWVPGDGGRIGKVDSQGAFGFVNLPTSILDTLRRVHFLAGDPMTGWAVGTEGRVLKTIDGGANWTVIGPQLFHPGSTSVPHDLYDIHFVSHQTGWLLGIHDLWITIDGGSSWNPVMLLDAAGAQLVLTELELYALDVVPAGGDYIGLACAEPGLVLRLEAGTGGTVWKEIFDLRDKCGDPTFLAGCEQQICQENVNPPKFEPWDIEISRDSGNSLAVLVGGIGTTCGVVLAAHKESGYANYVIERHECDASASGAKDCPNDPLYNPNPSNATATWRHQSYRTLYGMAFLGSTLSAVAAGYNGQHLVRPPSATPGVRWEDRSTFSNMIFGQPGVHKPADAVAYPLLGAAAGATGAFVVGEGGHVRRSTDGGHTWTNVNLGEPYRTKAIYAFPGEPNLELQELWMTGQFFRLARSTNGGKTWTEALPMPNHLAAGNFYAITFADDLNGVAVGDIDGGQGLPKILWTENNGQTDWNVPDSINTIGTSFGPLREVAHAGGDAFWAAGRAGTLFSSVDKGQNWTQFVPSTDPLPSFSRFDAEGVSFRDASSGIFVGSRSGRGVAYHYLETAPGSHTWTEISPAGTETQILSDVDVQGGLAYAVGEKVSGALRSGVVLVSTAVGGAFGPFVEVDSFPACVTGEDLEREPALIEVEIAPNGDVWAAGECGRAFRLSGGAWSQIKTNTDAHILDLSIADGAVYMAGFRSSQTQQSLVRFVTQ